MEQSSNEIKINCKESAPFLLAASFQGLVQFIGSDYSDGILYWKFTPTENVKKLLTQLKTKTEPRIPANDLFNAINTWWQEIGEMKKLRNGGIKYGKYT
ncbi:MAG TPA: hypothetical protein VLG12_07105 [Candidatus Saccharimonadales bacterium]|nr:hypothetical protein [Candidatus Saccharimonadales bacterium]